MTMDLTLGKVNKVNMLGFKEKEVKQTPFENASIFSYYDSKGAGMNQNTFLSKDQLNSHSSFNYV